LLQAGEGVEAGQVPPATASVTSAAASFLLPIGNGTETAPLPDRIHKSSSTTSPAFSLLIIFQTVRLMKLSDPKSAVPILLETALVAAFAVSGVLLRLQLPSFSQNSLSSALGISFFYANIIGCFLLGLISKSLQSESSNRVVMSALAIGFCGSLTTFSAWMVKVADEVVYERIDDALLLLLINLICVIAAYRGGVALSSLIGSMPMLPLVLIAIIMLASVISAFITPPNLTKALIFAPIGSLIRFFLARFLNPKNDKIPIGTLTANLVGCSLSAALSRSSDPWIIALVVGGIGSLSTTSSFVKELEERENNTKFLYGSVSIAAAVVLCLAFFGILHLSLD
jgi:CrcB protein